jgi:SAM-dependent methyltransferase
MPVNRSHSTDARDTAEPGYADRLVRLQMAWWKRLLPVQAPYRWNVRRLRLGFTLDVGCGIGRNLAHIDGHGVGVDHNRESVKVARALGLTAFTPEEFEASPYARASVFESLLAAHVVEHLAEADGVQLLRRYLRYVRPGGRLVLITPQEAGYASDRTHVTCFDVPALDRLGASLGVQVDRAYSFPLPRWAGRAFRYNEFVWVGHIGARR